jgi:hypothetical protein
VADVAVLGSGTDSATLADADVVTDALATLGVAAVTSTADSDAAQSAASVQIAGATGTLLGEDLIFADTISAAATCPTGGTPVASANVVGLEVLGDAVTLSAADPLEVVTAVIADGPLAGLTLTATVTQTVTTTATTAAAAAITATIGLAGDLLGAPIDVPVGTVTLAEASCEAPTVIPVTASTIDPQVGPTTGGQSVTITGTGFQADVTDVTFAGVPATSVTVDPSGTSLVAVTPAGPAGATEAAVSNPGSTATLPYTYVAPAISGISPDSGPAAGGTEVTLTGSGLQTTTGVTFDGEPATVLEVSPDGTSVIVETPAGVGFADVELTVSGGTVVPAPEQFLYVTPTGPSVSGIDPAAGPTAGGTTITISGTDLADTTEVRFNGVPGTIVGTPSDTELVVTTPAGAAGPADVAILTDDAASDVEDGFLYVAPPTATGISPDEGPATGGTTVTVNGSGFVPGATSVTICGRTISGDAVNVASDGTSLTFATPACAVGTTPLTVTTAGGETAALEFRYLAAAAGTSATSSSDGSLARTGSSTTPGSLIVPIAMLMAGLGALVIAARRRRTE